MKNLESNLEKIEQLAEERLSENLAFQTYLKTQNSLKIDEIVHRLYKEVESKIDCRDCGNCCQNLRPIASHKELRQFVAEEDIESVMYAESIKCMHHKNKVCTDYFNRPEECRLFPYLDQDNFISKTYSAIQNYRICPHVFNVVEGLKAELKWDYKNVKNTKK
ncbi:YkgJ family cysteine cluster protein [Ancylomarina sp. 16SWW S1-10-2]|uniref:YkgJ family cysteine cluster protein n=1 Tax=Ancylomarina sp. 16SWW S1-10-2 TaxID=2499681 RepID=UPI0012ADE0C4|nr:YkgJ family cysteine cluster protein [Ancylomarina sp. 16SWW S1-10-2]MRT92696.1 YkgJ family cysteine cluster protein [Ancylomarina sp. 16SWW S1-10-2]